MKTVFTLMLFVVSFIKVYGQNKNRAWLPEKYVLAISNRDTLAYKQLMPLSGFMYDEHGNLKILTYYGEISPLKVKKVVVGEKEKYELSTLHYNLNYVPREEASKLSSSTFFLSQTREKTLVEIIHGRQKTEIYFIDHDGDYHFKNIRESLAHLRNKYNIHNGPQPIKIER